MSALRLPSLCGGSFCFRRRLQSRNLFLALTAIIRLPMKGDEVDTGQAILKVDLYGTAVLLEEDEQLACTPTEVPLTYHIIGSITARK